MKIKQLLRKVTLAAVATFLVSTSFAQNHAQFDSDHLMSIAKMLGKTTNAATMYVPETVTIGEYYGQTVQDTYILNYTYKANGLMESVNIIQPPDPEIIFNYTLTYNDANQLILVTGYMTEIYNGNNITYEFARIHYTYTNQLLTNILAQADWMENGQFVDVSQYSYEYDAESNLIRETMQENDNGWENEYKIEYTYEYGMLINMVEYEWENGNWFYEENNLFEYDVMDRLVSIIEQEWNNNWQNTEKYNLVYNGRMLSNYVQQEWQNANNSWADDEQVVYTYDANGNCTNAQCQRWNGSAWANSTDDMEFPVYYNNMASLLELPLEFSEHNNITITYTTVAPEGIEDKNITFGIYPNPTTNTFTVDCEGYKTIEVYNTNGQLVAKQASNTFNASDWAAGMYLVKVTMNDGTLTSKNVIVK